MPQFQERTAQTDGTIKNLVIDRDVNGAREILLRALRDTPSFSKNANFYVFTECAFVDRR
ncbi:MAG: hypothetical protein BWK80_06540 [Desulfobacteraceae bacterium IS3]|nr:MAG: hypothetical protein BWK80_06540 [Desulfobacteraceae bacterium IS3]